MTGEIRVETDPPGFADWAAVLGLLRDSFAYMHGRVDPPSSLTRIDLPGLVAKAGSETVILAFDGAVPVGCAFCAPKDGWLYVGKVATAASHRGRGIARAMMARAGEVARDMALAGIELQVRVEMTEVQETYTRLGFRQVGATAHPGYDRPTSLTLRRPLEGQ